MTAAAPTIPAETPAGTTTSTPDGWEKLRQSADIQFEPVELPEIPPRQPGAFERGLETLFEWLGTIFGPLGKMLAGTWFWLQWVLLALVVAFVIYLVVRTFGPMARSRRAQNDMIEDEWRPDEATSMALLEDADRLAAEGRFDEATHLLLTRSVGQIAAARPDWVEPSSTARELAALPALSDTARDAFRVIAERVERSLFALSALDRSDWEAARSAYARFALARIEARL
jgi:hypothetical protein